MLLLVRARPKFHLCSFLSRFNYSWIEYTDRHQSRLFLREKETRRSFDERTRQERKEQEKMSHNMAITFLGTSSGGGPCDTRSCSSVALDLLGNGDLWCKPFEPFSVGQCSTDRRLISLVSGGLCRGHTPPVHASAWTLWTSSLEDESHYEDFHNPPSL